MSVNEWKGKVNNAINKTATYRAPPHVDEVTLLPAHQICPQVSTRSDCSFAAMTRDTRAVQQL